MRQDRTVRLNSGLTWYRITGDLEVDEAPLIVLHGGPGSTHDYLHNYGDLAAGGRAVIHYDQIGNGRSASAQGRSAGSWTIGLFLAQLGELIEHLGIQGRYAVLGHSWGGMLAAEHAVRQPAGLVGLVLANTPASIPLRAAEAARLRAALPDRIRATLAHHERLGSVDHVEYREAAKVYYRRHLCRLERWPPELIRTVAFKDAHPTVYATMVGPSEFHITGTLRDWSIVDRCDRISVPSLLLSGRHDEATTATVEPFAERIPGAAWTIFEHSSHMPHIEERAACIAAVATFLAKADCAHPQVRAEAAAALQVAAGAA